MALDDVPRPRSKEEQMKGEQVKKDLWTLGRHSLFRCSTDAMRRKRVSGFILSSLSSLDGISFNFMSRRFWSRHPLRHV